MSNDRYEKIRQALSMGPTPGPWKWWEDEDRGDCRVNPCDGGLLIAKCDVRSPFDSEQRANAALIAACDPDTIRELLAERDALAAENARLRRGAHPAITHCDNCGCDWLDNGLNPIGCPYCELRREVERRWEGNRRAAQDDTTHASNCWSWGHRHYECAVGQIERDTLLLRQALEALEQIATELPWELTGLQADTIAALRERLEPTCKQSLQVAEQQGPEHISSPECWCHPELEYKDPDTGAEVWVHRRMQ